MNGSPLTPEDAMLWIRRDGLQSADVVFLSLQECPSAAASPMSAEVKGAAAMRTLCGGTWSAEPRFVNDIPSMFDYDGDTTIRSIYRALSPDYELVADWSMGEDPKGRAEQTLCPGVYVQWYGHIRILLFAKNGEYISDPVGRAVSNSPLAA